MLLAVVCLFGTVAFAVPLGNAPSLTLNFKYPDSSITANAGLFVRGDGCGLNWAKGVEAQKAASDTWTVSLTCSNNFNTTSGVLSYKALVGDQDWQLGANSMVRVGQLETVDNYPWFYSSKGSFSYIRNVHSKELGNDRDLVIYVPPSYAENTFKTIQHVLVMHDGQNLFDPKTSFLGIAWMCQDTVNNLVIEGQMEEIAIIGVDNTGDRTDELTYSYDKTVPGGGKGDKYLDFLESTVIPTVADKFRFNVTSRANLGILGSSLGGLISCYAGWTRGNKCDPILEAFAKSMLRYGKAGCMSSSFWWNSQDFNSTIIPKPAPPPSEAFYLDSGDSGPGKDDKTETLLVRSDMEGKGWEMGKNLFYYLDKGGEHNEK